MRLAKLFLVLFTSVYSYGALAADEVQTAKDELNQLISLMSQLEQNVERIDQGRLRLLKEQCSKTLATIASRGLANGETMANYQQLIVYFRHSFMFFRQISNQQNDEPIQKILAFKDTIEKARGFDDAPYTKITFNVFTLQKKLFDQLMTNVEISQELHGKLIQMQAPMGQLIALASQGDHRLVYPPAVEMYHSIVALYEDFSKIGRYDIAFYSTLEIQGLNEFYGEYAKIYSPSEPEKTEPRP